MIALASQDTTTNTIEWQVWRCRYCGRVLAELALQKGSVRKVCERCKKMNVISISEGTEK